MNPRAEVERKSSDILIIGAGAAGLAAAIEAADGGREVLLVEATDRVGGVLEVSSGQMSAGGTALQQARGIEDSPEAHFRDILRIAGERINQDLVRKAVELAPSTIDWLCDNGFDVDPVCPALYHFHEAYRVPRTYWGVEKGLSVLAVLESLLAPHLASGRIELRLGSRCTGLSLSDEGLVESAAIGGPSGTRHIGVGDVVVAAGGHTESPEALRRFTTGEKVLSGGWDGSDGSMIPVLDAVGATYWGQGVFTPTYGGIEEPPGSGRVNRRRMPDLVPQNRQPWEIHVSAAGSRFVREDVDSVDLREKALARLRPMMFWVVGDARIEREAPALFPSWSTEEVAAAWNDHPGFVRADTLGALAVACEMDPATLHETVEGYNRAVARLQEDVLERTHLPLPIAEAPFWAIRNHGSLVKSFAGVRVDLDLRVMTKTGPIPNLYAVGEALGGATLSHETFVGGMSLTPALSFGRAVGRRLAERSTIAEGAR